MNKKIIVIGVAAALLLSGCSGSQGGGTQAAGGTNEKVYTLKIGNVVSDVDPFDITYKEFEKAVEEASGGRIQVEVFNNGSVAETDTDVLDKVRSNTLQMGSTTANCFAALSDMKEYYVYGVPYLMATNDELNTVAESEWISGLNKEFCKSTGVRVFEGGGVNMGFFGFGATNKEIKTLDDLKGMSIRINQTNQMIALTSGAGINPQFIAFSEVYTALAQGTVDGMITNTPLYYSNGFYDQLKSIYITHCGESYHFYVINDDFYNSLPEDLQQLLDEEVAKMITKTRELEDDYMVESMNKVAASGVVVTEASVQDEQRLKQISVDNVWWDESVSLTPKENINQVLEILGRTDEAQ